MSKEYYLWTQNYTRLEKVIGAHGVDYLADNLRQITIKIIMLKDVTTIKPLNKYKTPITLEELKKRLFLVKNKKEVWYKAEHLDQINFFLR